MAKFPFTDLHSFKDYVGFVRLCAPDLFPEREGMGPEDQWSLDLAFEGLRYGLKLARKEKGERQVFSDCERLVSEAYDLYRAGRVRDGFSKLDQVKKLLKTVPSQ